MEKALANMALKTAETACAKEPETSAKSVTTPTETTSALKGVSQSLLERVSQNGFLFFSFVRLQESNQYFLSRFALKRLRNCTLLWHGTHSRKSACRWCHGCQSWPGFCEMYLWQRKSRPSSWSLPANAWSLATDLLSVLVSTDVSVGFPTPDFPDTIAVPKLPFK